MSRLRSSAMEMEELKNLIKVVWSKRQSKDLLETVAQIQKEENEIRTLKVLEGYMGKPKFFKLMKGFEF